MAKANDYIFNDNKILNFKFSIYKGKNLHQDLLSSDRG